MATMKTLNGYGFNATELNGKAASDYLQKTDTATNSAKLGGKAPEYYIQPRNLLDNSDFRKPVNQRGQTTYNRQWQYTIDRWFVASASTDGVVSLDITDSGITITNTTGNIFFVQRVPKALITSGNAYTLAYQKSDGTIVVTIVTGFEEVGGESYQVVYVIPSGTTIVWAALYEGAYTADTLPPYVPKGYAAELAECRRYAKRIGGALAGIAHGYESGKAYATIFTSGPTMRITPSVDDYSKIQIINGQHYSDSFTSITGIATIATREDSITFWIESSEISAGKDYYISCEKGVVFSSDL